MFEAAKTLTAPLADEEIRVEFIKDGKKVSGTHRVGDRVASFKKMIEEEEKKLDDLWKQWDEVQTEYVALGTEVFGREAFRIEKEGREIGYKKDMELLDLETAARVEALEDEIEAIGPEILKKMKASEKVRLAPLWRGLHANGYRIWTRLRRRIKQDFCPPCSEFFGLWIWNKFARIS